MQHTSIGLHIKQLNSKPRSASSHDGLTSQHIRNLDVATNLVLLDIIDDLLATGTVPNNLNLMLVHPTLNLTMTVQPVLTFGPFPFSYYFLKGPNALHKGGGANTYREDNK